MSDQPTAVVRAGFAALVGRPNVGKSTLLNALVGEKVSIVTSRPQTTRHRVLGVLNRPGVQLAFVDTPGLHLGERRALNRAMNRTAAAALADADLVVFVIEALRFGEEDDAPLPDGGSDPAADELLTKRSAEDDCALRIVRSFASDATLSPDLRARALYLDGTLDF